MDVLIIEGSRAVYMSTDAALNARQRGEAPHAHNGGDLVHFCRYLPEVLVGVTEVSPQ